VCVFTEQSRVLLQRVRRYQPIMRNWVGPVALIYLTRPEHIEVRVSREAGRLARALEHIEFRISREGVN